MWLAWIQDNAVLSLLIGLCLGGVIAGLSLFLGTWLYAHCTRPILQWGDVRVRGALLPPVYPEGGGSVGFYSSMIAVHNRGKTAAKNCSGHLEIEENREHVCWFLPHARRAITINRDDFEFLEVCGLQDEYALNIGREPQLKKRIAPTEDGWHPAGANRDLGSTEQIKAKIIITAANAQAIEMSITVLPIPDLADPSTTALFMRES